jgi:sodium-dependent dicarboxylate transporter 2/3/5
MTMPIALGMLVINEGKNSTPEAKFLLLGIAYAAKIGGIVTIIASTTNAFSANLLKLIFSEWLVYGVPKFFVTFLLMFLVLPLYFKPNRKMLIPTVVLP